MEYQLLVSAGDADGLDARIKELAAKGYKMVGPVAVCWGNGCVQYTATMGRPDAIPPTPAK